jgi:hypothetical protein
VLHRRGVERCAQFAHQRIALFAFGALNLHLDKFMGLQRALDLRYDGWGQTVAGDGHDGVQVMGPRAQVAALDRGEFDH